MAIESAKCVCCGLREDCTEEYIGSVKADFDGKWLCGLCAEAVRDELSQRQRRSAAGVLEEAITAHTAFCSKSSSSNPANKVADGMRQMLRRRSGDLSKPASPVKFGFRMARIGD
ncbi:uncharacterized protein LOC122007538 [Zingiber officinale]|uniref:DUF1677 family protein n=1 Tax=Zingiber officinale TaxID=94328 RepID=A0A8J5HVW2_ZINOF|nr:uncharacterized protein LOC122007538 [Zingiber officinale]KAG6536722.1 hypothetical protein ZIOFF_001789 [Zingiber officinale]